MGEEVGNQQSKSEEVNKDHVFEIRIKADTGQLVVSGPGDGDMFDEPICFWMLEKAKDYVKMFNMKAKHEKKPSIINPASQQPFYRKFGRK